MANSKISRRNFIRAVVASSVGMALYQKQTIFAQDPSVDIEGLARQYFDTLPEEEGKKAIPHK
jgi:hypothetical protein